MTTVFRPVVLVLLLLLGSSLPARAQIVFTTSAPNVDSFPIVRVGLFVTDSGTPATLVGPQNLQVKEDGGQVGSFDLTGCGGSAAAAIAFVIDTSSSIAGSVGVPGSPSYAMLLNAIAQCIARIPSPSQIAFVPFADSSLYSYPGISENYFYNTSTVSDTNAFFQHLRSVPLTGAGTDVDAGIVNAASFFSHANIQHKIIVLITDDAVTDAPALETLLKSRGIALYVLQVTNDSVHTNYANSDLAIATGGAYYAAYDSRLYLSGMLSLEQQMFSEHCTLRYTSYTPCPFYRSHTVRIDLNYKGNAQTVTSGYVLGKASSDHHAPVWQIDSLAGHLRAAKASDPFPCESGMKSIIDSGLSNMTSRSRSLTSTLGTDSLFVKDTLYPADADVIAEDSAGNISRQHIHYSPQPDVHAPQFLPFVWNAGAITLDIHEALPWDRGIASITLRPGTANLLLDSIQYFTGHSARTYFHLISPQLPAGGCLIAKDSAGNTDTSCIQWTGDTSDIWPPVITQDPLAEPRMQLTGTVTDQRPFDRGIQSVTVTPLANSIGAVVLYDSASHATVRAQLTDSLRPASVAVYAIDSVGHTARDTLRYAPQPDDLYPVMSYTGPTAGVFSFIATDSRPWDRGLASLQLQAGAINVAATPAIFADVHSGSMTITILDPTQSSTFTVEAIDSAGHSVHEDISVNGTPIVSMGDYVLNFGTITGGTTSAVQKPIVISNPNALPVTFALSPLAGDNASFGIITASPITVPAHGVQSVVFEYSPGLLGPWQASTRMMLDTTQLGTITLTAKRTGSYRLALDTVSTPLPASPGILHLSIDASPDPTNLDTIAFELTYNSDVMTFGPLPSRPASAEDTGIYAYDLSWSGADGDTRGLFIRRAGSGAAALAFGNTVIDLPFESHLAPSASTAIHITGVPSAWAEPGELYDGLVRAGASCGSQIMRDEMNGTPYLHLYSISPDPATSGAVAYVVNTQNGSAQLDITNLVGEVVRIIPLELRGGDLTVELGNVPARGLYFVTLRSGGAEYGRKTLIVN